MPPAAPGKAEGIQWNMESTQDLYTEQRKSQENAACNEYCPKGQPETLRAVHAVGQTSEHDRRVDGPDSHEQSGKGCYGKFNDGRSSTNSDTLFRQLAASPWRRLVKLVER